MLCYHRQKHELLRLEDSLCLQRNTEMPAFAGQLPDVWPQRRASQGSFQRN